MTTSTITGTIKDATGTALSGVTVFARLRPGAGFRTADGSEIVDVTTTTNGSGVWTLALERVAGINPANSYYEIEEQIPAANGGPRTWAITVGVGNATLYASLLNGLVPAVGLPTALTVVAGDVRYARLPVVGDGLQHVSTNGDDSLDGRSWGSAKATITAAIAALPSLGGTVNVGAGTHNVTAKITNSGVTQLRIRGQGVSTIIKAATGLNDHVFDLRGAGLIVEHLVVDGNKANQSPAGGDYRGIYITGVTSGLLFDVTVKNANSHGFLVENSGGPVSEFRVEQCIAQTCGTTTNLGNGFAFVACNRLAVTGNIGQNNVGDGFYFQSITDSTVAENVSQTNTGYGIELATQVNLSAVNGNVCLGNSESGIGADGLAAMNGVTFAGNVCESNGGAGIQISAGSGTPKNLILSANVCKNNSTAGLARVDVGVAGTFTAANTRDGIELSGAQALAIVGNQCFDDQGTKTQRYALSDGGGASSLLIVGNYFPDNRTGGMSLAGTGNVVGTNFTGTVVGAYSDDGHRAIVQADASIQQVLFRTNGGNDNYSAQISQATAGAALYLRGPLGELDVMLKRLSAVALGTDFNFAVNTAGQGFRTKEGSNAKQGTATLVAGAAVVSNTSVTASSRIMLTVQSLGTVAAPKAVAVTARTVSTSFTITSADGTDTSVVAYEIFEPA